MLDFIDMKKVFASFFCCMRFFDIQKLYKEERYFAFLHKCRKFGFLASEFQKIIAREAVGIKVSDSEVSKLLIKKIDKFTLYNLAKLSRHHEQLVLDFLIKNKITSNLTLALKRKNGIYFSDDEIEYLKQSTVPDSILILNGWKGLGDYFRKFDLYCGEFNNAWNFALDSLGYRQSVFFTPEVAIIITAHNSEETIDYCIDSLLKQTFRKIQIIIVDDASTDKTYEVIKYYSKKYKNVIAVRNKINVGTYCSKNIALNFVSSSVKYITCMDADDWAHPEKIERQVLAIETNNSVASVSYWVRFTKNGEPWALNNCPYLSLNRSSFMFVFKKLLTIGEEKKIWDSVRIGADRNIIKKTELMYGKEAIVKLKIPLSIGLKSGTSLTSSKKTGNQSVRGRYNRARYFESVFKN